jgi:prepilin-type N-terminal cleavage/methylation domain-containing protein
LRWREVIRANSLRDRLVFNSESAARSKSQFLLRGLLPHDKAALLMQDRQSHAFTLIELLIVITIVVVLLGLLFPAFQGVQERAKKVQAKNDLTQFVTAVNAFYTEYGRYPTAVTTDNSATNGPSGANANDALLNELRGLTNAALNTRRIVFINPPDARDQNSPRGGIKTSNWSILRSVGIGIRYRARCRLG